MRHAGHVHIVRAEVHEERLAAVPLYETAGVRHDAVGNVLVAPQGPSAAFHVAYARNAVHNALVVSVARPQFGQQFWVIAPRGFTLKVLLVTHTDGCIGVVLAHPSLFYVDAGHAVGRSRHDVVVVEAQVARRHVERVVPVLPPRFAAQPQVPFPYGRSGITSGAHEVGHGGLLGSYDGSRVARCHIRAASPEGVLARQHAVARGRRSRGTSVHVGKAQAVSGQTVGHGGVHQLRAVARKVAVAQIVGHQQNDVRLLRLCRGHGRRKSQQREECFHII